MLLTISTNRVPATDLGYLLHKHPDRPLEQYVNDRPYVASSFLSVALAKVFSTALSGRCKDRPELAETAIPCFSPARRGSFGRAN